jgi:hypothetical protein
MSELPVLITNNSGPIVIHVSSPAPKSTTNNNNNNKANMGAPVRKTRQGGRRAVLIIGFLVLLVSIVIFWESIGQLENASPRVASSSSSSESYSKKKQVFLSKSSPALDYSNSHQDFDFDINAPPIKKSFWDMSTERDEDVDQSSFIFWGRQQANRLDELDETVVKTRKKKKKKKKKLQPFPVITSDDDSVPQAAAGSVILAADALFCRKSVIDYVINATDLKDECDGLKKAFTKNCAGEEEPVLKSRRRLTKDNDNENDNGGYKTAKQRPINPLIWYQHRLHRITRYIRNWLEPKPVLLVEDEILEVWDEAALEVQQEWDWDLLSDDINNHRRLNEEESTERNLDETRATPVPNKTAVAVSNKPRNSLNLPTNLHHVSEKMLSETLMLSQEENIIKSVKNHTNATRTAAQTESAASQKAVSDTADLVSSVLNDPTSVEARTCCTSILNVFHENCFVDEEEELSDSRLVIVVAVIALCGLVKSLIRHFQIRWLPEAAGCILVGCK